MNRCLVLFALAVWLQSCASVPSRIASLPHYREVQEVTTMKVPYPIVLLHGLGQKSHVWEGKASQYFTKDLGLSSGGHLRTQGPIAKPVVVNEKLAGNADADFYTIAFRSSSDSINAWRNELNACVEYILQQTGADKVILVGYSMGGLAARAYLTYRLTDHHVKRLVTIGTPHLGSVYANVWTIDSTLRSCKASSNPVTSTACNLAFTSLHGTEGDLPYNAPAIRDLRRPEDGGSYLRALGKYAHPLDVEYVSVIGEVNILDTEDKLSMGVLQEVIRKAMTVLGSPASLFESGDGVVSAKSQNISNIDYFASGKNKRISKTITVSSAHMKHLEENIDIQRACLDDKPAFAGASIQEYDGKAVFVLDLYDNIPMLSSLGLFATPPGTTSIELPTKGLRPILVRTRDGITARYIIPITNDTIVNSQNVVFRYLVQNTFGYTISGSLEW